MFFSKQGFIPSPKGNGFSPMATKGCIYKGVVMSGGSFDYIYYRLEEASRLTSDKEIADLMQDLANLFHDEEWYRSGDYSKSDYLESLEDFKAKWFGKDSRSERVKTYVSQILEQTRQEIENL